MEEVTGTKERQVKNDIASKTNGDQASCKNPCSEDMIVVEGVTMGTENTESALVQTQTSSVIVMMVISCPVPLCLQMSSCRPFTDTV